MEIDTQTIRRLRDALIEGGVQPAASNAAASAPGRQASLERVAPFVETMFLMMVADGHHDANEEAAIRGAMRTLTHGLLDDAELDSLLEACAGRLAEQGVEARLQAVGNRICADRVDRETGFTLAAAIALADSEVAIEESALLVSIAEWYGISTRRRREILGQFDQTS
jgi:uncharacterized tellurite resistance protein B-like protein